MADLKTQVVIGADASGVEVGVNKAKKSLASLGDAAAKEGKKASDGLASIGDGGDQATAKVSRAEKSLIGSIQRTTAALEAGSRSGSKYFETLAAQRGVSVDSLKPYLDQLDAVNAKQKAAQNAISATSPVIKNIGVSAGQTAQALRQLPAQFSDIVVSLQAGQSPLTVFLQQGAQIKDSFGGVGAALRGVGGALIGLVNPFTLATAAVSALGFAYYQGSKEADEFAKSLILSGNSAGTTVGQLSAMAQRIDKITGTQGEASAALAQFAANSNIASKSIENFTAVAIKLESATGQAVKETVKQFAELGKEPVTAAIKLNETTNFLTESVYQQIKALDEQGKSSEAAAVAQKAYADTLDSRIGQLTERLGVFQRAWRALGKDAKEAWDLLLNVGRPDTLQDQLGKAQAQLQERINRGPLAALGDRGQAALDKGNQGLKDRIANLQETINLENRSATQQKEAADRVKNRIAFDKEADKYQSKAEQRAKEIAKANVLADKAGASSAERAKVIAGINEKYKEKSGGGGSRGLDTSRVDAAAQANLDIADIKAKSAAIIDTNANTERVLEAQRAAGLVNESDYYAKKKALLEDNMQAQVDALNAENKRLEQESLNTKDSLDRDRKILENRQKIAKLTADATAQQTILDIQATAAISARAKALLSAKQAAEDYFQTTNRQQQRDLDAFGKGRSQRDLDSGIAQIEDRYGSQKRDLENNRAQLELEGKFTEDARKQYEERLNIITDYQSKAIASFEGYYAKRKELETSFTLGAQEALQNYAVDSKNVFDQTAKAVSNTFNGLEDALVNFAKTGKLSFKDLADSIIDDFARIAIKQSITGPLANAFTGALSGNSGASSDSGWIGAILGAFGGARAIGGPVSAGRAYQVNERGPETLNIGGKQILMMGSQGGTVTPGASAGQSVAVHNTFVLQQPASRDTQEQIARRTGQSVNRAMARNG